MYSSTQPTGFSYLFSCVYYNFILNYNSLIRKMINIVFQVSVQYYVNLTQY